MQKSATPDHLPHEKLVLQLYVSGMSQKSMEAIENIKNICDNHVKVDYELEIIDIYKHPELASEQHIVFSPSLVKQSPLPRKTLIGTLSDVKKVIRAIGISPKT